MKKDLLVPDIGDFENVEIIELLVKQGQKISINDPIVTLESDKSSVEVPSTLEGVVKNVNVKIGDKVSKDDLIITLDTLDKQNEKIPVDTEKIIEEAEKTLSPKEEPKEEKENIEAADKKQDEKIQVLKNGDIDPTETKEWLESLSAVLESQQY